MEKFQKILELFESSSLEFLSYDDHSLKIEMRKNSQDNFQQKKQKDSLGVSPSFSSSANVEEKNEQSYENQNFYSMVCPTVGIFYRRPSPQEDNYVEVGDRVKKGDVLCTLEAMKVFSEVKSPVDGVIRSIALKDGDMAGQGDLLFEIELC